MIINNNIQLAPNVSVIVPCYMQGEFLDDCISSVINQTYSNWECIIINDGSQDNTEEISQKWREKDARIKYFKKENGGLCSARNFGINLSSGKYILPLDADDMIGSQYMELAMPKFTGNIKIVYCKADFFGKIVGSWELQSYSWEKLLLYNMIFCSAFFLREDWEKIGGYDVNMIYGLEDWEFWINMLKNGGGVIQLDSTQFFYRKKKTSMTDLVSLNKTNEEKMLNYITEKHISLYNSVFGNPISLYSKLLEAKLEAKLEIEKIKKELNIMRNSKSWRLTQPFRNIMSLIKK